MTKLRARTLHRYGNGRVVPVGVAIVRRPDAAFVEPVAHGAPAPRKRVSLAHKERIMAELIDHPAGLTTEVLAAVLGLGAARTYVLVRELVEEGLVDLLGTGADSRWIAQV